MTLPIIQSLWIGKSCSVIERLAMCSFIKSGHEFHLYTYDDVANIPEGVIIKDANTIISENNVFLSHNSYAHFADWFRWKMLNKIGGYWVDMDLICLKPFDFSDKIIFGKEQYNSASIGVLRFPKGHELTSYMVKRCENPNLIEVTDSIKVKARKLKRKILMGNRISNTKWGEAGGPWGFKQALLKFGLWDAGKPYTYFYPVHSSHWKYIFDETFENDTALFFNTYAIHMWNEMINKDASFNRNGVFPAKSLFEHLKSKYYY